LSKYIDIFVILWYIYTVCDPSQMSRFNACLVSGLIGTSLLGMPALAWEQETQLMTQQEECIPSVSISDNVVDNTIRIQVAEGNTCPISDRIFLFIQDNRPQPLKLSGLRENFFSSTWVVRPDGARPGQYRVMGFDPTPNGIGDNDYIRSRDLGIDQVLTVGGNQGQEQSAPALPQLTLPLAPRQEVAPQRPEVSLDADSKRLIQELLELLQWFKEALLRLQAALNQTS